MPAWLTLDRKIWSGDAPGFYVGGPGNWRQVYKPSNYPANNVDGLRDGVQFTRDGDSLEAFLKEQLLVMLMVSDENRAHSVKSLISGFMWDNAKWTGGTIELVDGLVKISEHSRPE